MVFGRRQAAERADTHSPGSGDAPPTPPGYQERYGHLHNPIQHFLRGYGRDDAFKASIRAFDYARDEYLTELGKQKTGRHEKSVGKKKEKYLETGGSLLRKAVVALREKHALSRGSQETSEAYERDVDLLWKEFFLLGDAAVLSENGVPSEEFLMQEPDLILLFGTRTLEQARGPRLALLTEVTKPVLGELEGSSQEFLRIQEEFESARATYFVAYHRHLEGMKSVETRDTLGLAGLHRHKIGAIRDERTRYLNARKTLLLYLKNGAGEAEEKTRDMTKLFVEEEQSLITIQAAALNREQTSLLDALRRAYGKVPPLMRPILTSLLIGLVAGGAVLLGGATAVAATGAGLGAAAAYGPRAYYSLIAGMLGASLMDTVLRLRDMRGTKSEFAVEDASLSLNDEHFAAVIDRKAKEVFKHKNRKKLDDLSRRLFTLLAGFGAAGLAASLYDPTSVPAPDVASPEAPAQTPEAPTEAPATSGAQVQPPLIEEASVDAGEGAIQTFKEFFTETPKFDERFALMLRDVGVDTNLPAPEQADALARTLGFLTRAGESPVIPEGATFEFVENEGVWMHTPQGEHQQLIDQGPDGKWVATPYTAP